MSVPAVRAARKAGLDTGDLDLRSVTIRMMPPAVSRVLGSRVGAMTVGNDIFVTHDKYDDMVGGRNPVLLLHELVHVHQWRREGPARFLARYVCDYVWNRLIGLDHHLAYRAIGFEAAAFDTSERPEREPA